MYSYKTNEQNKSKEKSRKQNLKVIQTLEEL